jgi:hypothetical protein
MLAINWGHAAVKKQGTESKMCKSEEEEGEKKKSTLPTRVKRYLGTRWTGCRGTFK